LFFSKEINPRFYRGNKNALVKKNGRARASPKKALRKRKPPSKM